MYKYIYYIFTVNYFLYELHNNFLARLPFPTPHTHTHTHTDTHIQGHTCMCVVAVVNHRTTDSQTDTHTRNHKKTNAYTDTHTYTDPHTHTHFIIATISL